MKSLTVSAFAAVLAISACGKDEKAPESPPRGAVSDRTIRSAVPSSTPEMGRSAAGRPAFVAGRAPSEEFLVGSWGEDDGCQLALNFQADGTIKDGPFDRWTLRDGYLAMEGSPQRMKLQVVDAGTMTSELEGASGRRTLKRC